MKVIGIQQPHLIENYSFGLAQKLARTLTVHGMRVAICDFSGTAHGVHGRASSTVHSQRNTYPHPQMNELLGVDGVMYALTSSRPQAARDGHLLAQAGRDFIAEMELDGSRDVLFLTGVQPYSASPIESLQVQMSSEMIVYVERTALEPVWLVQHIKGLSQKVVLCASGNIPPISIGHAEDTFAVDDRAELARLCDWCHVPSATPSASFSYSQTKIGIHPNM